MYWELPHSESLTDCSEFTSLLAAATVLPLSSCADMKAFYDTHIEALPALLLLERKVQVE